MGNIPKSMTYEERERERERESERERSHLASSNMKMWLIIYSYKPICYILCVSTTNKLSNIKKAETLIYIYN